MPRIFARRILGKWRTVSVQFDWVRMRTSRKSLYASKSVNNAVEIIPGHMMGMITLKNAVKRFAPSTMADSSISLGMFIKKLRSIQMVKGWLIATSVMISRKWVSYRPRALTEPPVWQNVRHTRQGAKSQGDHQDNHAGDAAVARQPIARQTANRYGNTDRTGGHNNGIEEVIIKGLRSDITGYRPQDGVTDGEYTDIDVTARDREPSRLHPHKPQKTEYRDKHSSDQQAVRLVSTSARDRCNCQPSARR